VELKRLFEPDVKDQLWTHTKALMHDPVKWRLYDTCGVHYVLTRDQEIFMLVEKDYPLRKRLEIVMIRNKLQERIVGNKMLKSFPLLVKKFPLLEDFPTASEERFPLLSIRDAPAEEVCTAKKLKANRQRDYWKIIRLGWHTAVYQFFVDMLKQFDREDLNQLWALVKETLSIRQASRDKEKELWVELKRLFEPDFEDQLWTHTQALMHDPLEWRLYDTCGVHHVFTKD
nr:hypothetical protein [Tanacetum cinerariifolium]